MTATRHLEQGSPSRELEAGRLPVVDLVPWLSGGRGRRGSIVRATREACLDPGFFQVRSGGVGQTDIDTALDAMKAFFDHPDDSPVKRGAHNGKAGGMKGWGPLFGEPAYQAGTVAHVESFDFGQQLAPAEYRSLGIEPNIWPELPGFRRAMLDFYKETTRLGRAVAEVLSEILGEERDFINRHSGPSAPRTMRMLHYPANEIPPDGRNVGISAHTDFECFTLLYQTAPGLELTDVSGRWYHAPSDPGRFTVLVGDMTERLSNGWLKATGHRVAHTPWPRYSMVLFFALDGDYRVEPLPGFTDRDRPARFPPVTQDEHIAAELQAAGGNRRESG